MSIIAFVNQKGGCGKSTCSVHLAAFLLSLHHKNVLLIDADAQQSSSLWAKALSIPYATIGDADDLFDSLPGLAKKCDFLIVDGPGSYNEVTKSILTRADLALIPCQPTGLDLASSNKIIRALRQAQELRAGLPNAYIFLNRAVKGTLLLRESQRALKDLGIAIASSVIHQRQAIADAPSQGSTVWQMPAVDAARDFELLFEEVLFG